MNQALRNLAYKLTSKHIAEDKLRVLEIHLDSTEISYFNLSTNSIISFEHNGSLCYFRECPELLPEAEYFETAVSDFFARVRHLGISEEHFKQEIPVNLQFSEENISAFFSYVNSEIKDGDLLNKLYQTDIISESTSFSIWENQTYDEQFFASFGLVDLPQSFYDIAVYFLWYMRSAAYTYRTLNIVKGERYSYFSAVRSVSTAIVAQELRLGDMVTNSEWCRIITNDGKIMFGVISNSAPGSRMCDTKALPCPSLQRELINLNILDLICYQTDHGPNNYNVNVSADGTYAVCAFDNDNPYTFFPITKLQGSFAGCSPFIDKKGNLLRPYLDKTVASAVLNADIKNLAKRLSPYLNKLQINATLRRIKKLQRLIKKCNAGNPGILIAPDAFSEQTVNEELSGKYGVTYLTKIKE